MTKLDRLLNRYPELQIYHNRCKVIIGKLLKLVDDNINIFSCLSNANIHNMLFGIYYFYDSIIHSGYIGPKIAAYCNANEQKSIYQSDNFNEITNGIFNTFQNDILIPLIAEIINILRYCNNNDICIFQGTLNSLIYMTEIDNKKNGRTSFITRELITILDEYNIITIITIPLGTKSRRLLKLCNADISLYQLPVFNNIQDNSTTGEKIIYSILLKNGFNNSRTNNYWFKSEHNGPIIIGPSPTRYDFVLYINNTVIGVIEFNGVQHSIANTYYNNLNSSNNERLNLRNWINKRVLYDIIKRQYALEKWNVRIKVFNTITYVKNCLPSYLQDLKNTYQIDELTNQLIQINIE
jgi:hypothetical protein